MPDPAWTGQYNFAQTPENNGFTRRLYNAPVLILVTSGSPANRRVEINSDSGDIVFLTSQVPSLDPSVGATVQMQVQVSGAGDAGFELTFLDRQFQVQVYADRVTVTQPDGTGEHQIHTGDNASATVTVRATVSPDGTLRIYRNTTLLDTRALASNPYPFQRVLWWGESGGVQVFRQLAYYIGGPVVP